VVPLLFLRDDFVFDDVFLVFVVDGLVVVDLVADFDLVFVDLVPDSLADSTPESSLDLIRMVGTTPAPGRSMCFSSFASSSSRRMANCKYRGVMRLFLWSAAAFPDNSKISASKYSRTAAR